jgi:hypothetical protein
MATATTGATGSVLVFSDVHFDPFADPALVPGPAAPGHRLRVAGGVMPDPVPRAAYADGYAAQADTDAAVTAQTLPVCGLALTNATPSGYAAASALLAAS